VLLGIIQSSELQIACWNTPTLSHWRFKLVACDIALLRLYLNKTTAKVLFTFIFRLYLRVLLAQDGMAMMFVLMT